MFFYFCCDHVFVECSAVPCVWFLVYSVAFHVLFFDVSFSWFVFSSMLRCAFCDYRIVFGPYWFCVSIRS